MPVLDGLQAAAQIRAYEAAQALPACRIVAVTAARELDSQHLRSASLDECVGSLPRRCSRTTDIMSRAPTSCRVCPKVSISSKRRDSQSPISRSLRRLIQMSRVQYSPASNHFSLSTQRGIDMAMRFQSSYLLGHSRRTAYRVCAPLAAATFCDQSGRASISSVRSSHTQLPKIDMRRSMDLRSSRYDRVRSEALAMSPSNGKRTLDGQDLVL